MSGVARRSRESVLRVLAAFTGPLYRSVIISQVPRCKSSRRMVRTAGFWTGRSLDVSLTKGCALVYQAIASAREERAP
jgi:hypothetical protein